VRAYLRRRGIRAVIPTRQDQRANPHFDRQTYRRRNVMERCVGWLKENRRLATRYEKLAVNYLAVVKRMRVAIHTLDGVRKLRDAVGRATKRTG
jgi:transposase